jgi:hypothetical protein
MAGSTEENRATAIKFIKRMKVCRGIDPELITEDFQRWSPGSGYFNAPQIPFVHSRGSVLRCAAGGCKS